MKSLPSQRGKGWSSWSRSLFGSDVDLRPAAVGGGRLVALLALGEALRGQLLATRAA